MVCVIVVGEVILDSSTRWVTHAHAHYKSYASGIKSIMQPGTPQVLRRASVSGGVQDAFALNEVQTPRNAHYFTGKAKVKGGWKNTLYITSRITCCTITCY